MLSKKNRHWFLRAKKEMEKSTFTRVHIGCVIVKGNKVLGRGHNQEKSHPKQRYLNRKCKEYDTEDSYLHSELNAILHATTDKLEGASIYLYRENNSGNICCCKPCPACEFVIRQVGITTVYYTDKNKFVKKELRN